jgi:hypothetical protein
MGVVFNLCALYADMYKYYLYVLAIFNPLLTNQYIASIIKTNTHTNNTNKTRKNMSNMVRMSGVNRTIDVENLENIVFIMLETTNFILFMLIQVRSHIKYVINKILTYKTTPDVLIAFNNLYNRYPDFLTTTFTVSHMQKRVKTTIKAMTTPQKTQTALDSTTSAVSGTKGNNLGHKLDSTTTAASGTKRNNLQYKLDSTTSAASGTKGNNLGHKLDSTTSTASGNNLGHDISQQQSSIDNKNNVGKRRPTFSLTNQPPVTSKKSLFARTIQHITHHGFLPKQKPK